METKELIAAFIKAQGEIEGALKDKLNPHFKSKYADLSAVVDAIKPALQKHGLGFVQVSHDADHCACIETLIVHTSGQTMSAGKVSVPVSKIDAQGYGSAMTYARRYSLSAAFGVCPEDDDGNAAAKAKPDTHHQPPVIDLSKLAKQVSVFIAKGENYNAFETIELANLSNDQKLELWQDFDSNERSILTEYSKAKHAGQPKENSNVV